MSEAVAEPIASTPEPEPEPEPEPVEPEPEPEPEPEARCEAETTVGGTRYRCALEAGHDDEHRFQPLEDAAPAQEPDAKDISKRLRQLENEAERHAKRIQEIIGADAEGLIMCELCPPNFGGWRFDNAPSEEVTQRVRVAIGLPDVSNFASSATERVCDDCRGLGKVRTGSLVPNRETVTCDACAGKGYVASRPRQNTETPEAPPAEPANGTAVFHDDGIRRDMFGTPEGDPDYEKMPSARARPIEYWQQHRT
jgi:hypothetical protein